MTVHLMRSSKFPTYKTRVLNDLRQHAELGEFAPEITGL
jgi:hypothetical protein